MSINSSDTHKGDIQIVDDNLDNLNILASMIKKHGYDARMAINGELALKSIRSHPPDLILLDILMPGLSGFEVCKQLKADALTNKIPIIFISALYKATDKLKAFSIGAVDYITKPFQKEEVMARVETHLSLRKIQKRLKTQNAMLQQEISDRKQAGELLRESEKINRNLLSNLNAGVVAHAPDTSILMANPAACKLLGLTENQMMGIEAIDPQWSFLRDDGSVMPLDEYPVNQVLSRKDVLLNLVVGINRPKTGDVVWLLVNGFPVTNDSGEIEQIIINFIDITKRKRAEEEKARLEGQYRQAQKVEAIGRLAGGVAHDLNNLLVPILGYGEMLVDDFSPEDARRESARQIVNAGFRARNLVRQLLAFSRKQALEYRTLDLNKIIGGFEKLLRRTIREDIGIKIILSPDIRTIRADIGQIEQVIMNLAVNAQDAMPQGGKLILETAMAELDEEYAAPRPGVQPGSYVMLAVSDTGCGMDEETCEQIFDPFYSTKGEQGTGMGLATVYGIVKQHGGNIWVYSESGKGASFKVYLPVSEETHIEKKTLKKAAEDTHGSETILLVEDNEKVRGFIYTILKRMGYTVLKAENGAEALPVLASHAGQVNLLLTDVVMPGMSGKALFAKAAEKHPDLKVLYMSGYTGNVIVHRGVLDEGIAFIQKPFPVKALAAKVREVLDN